MANAVSLAVKTSATIAGISFGGVSRTIAVDSPQGFEVVVAHGATVFEIDFVVPLPAAGLKLLMFDASQDCTLSTNHAAGSSPDQTIALKANTILQWDSNMATSLCPVTVAVAKFYVAVAGTVDCTLKVGIGLDITP